MIDTLDRVEIESAGSDPVRLARALLKQLPELDGRVPIHEIALALDIVSIETIPLRSIEACLQCDRHKSEGQIVLRAGRSPQRHRYSIGHELGHFLNERHEPIGSAGFDCTHQDMSAPIRNGRHLRQEQEANTFAIEVLTPRRLLRPYFAGAPDLEHALEMAKHFHISRAAATRRYVDLHDAQLAAVFAKNDRITYINRSEGFPITHQWSGDPAGPNPAPPKKGTSLTEMEEVDPETWLASPDRWALFAQTFYQQDGYATTLLLAEPVEEAAAWEPQFRKGRRKP